MKFYVGYIFTESVIDRLSAIGFSFQKNDATLKDGYREFILAFPNSENIELRQIVDEDLYFKSQNKKDLSPFFYDTIKELDYKNQPNTAISVSGFVDKNMDDCALKEFLQIRKRHSIWGLILNCTDFEKFKKMSETENFFTWQNHKTAVIHLGSACFDLIIQDKI